MPRPKSFDPEAKLDEAMRLFWRDGFQKTSIPALERELGINRFSLYATWGDKRTLFLAALDRYEAGLIDGLIRPLEEGTAGLADLHSFTDSIRGWLLDLPDARGCLLCNSATELGLCDSEVAARVRIYFERVEKAVLAALRRALDLGELHSEPDRLALTARLTRTALQGVLVQMRSGCSLEDVEESLRAIESVRL